MAALLAAPGIAAELELPRCGERGAMADLLHKSFGERRVAWGLSADGTLVEVFAGPADTFTVLKTQAAGRSCIVDTGYAWHGDVAAQERAGPARRTAR